jgi:hypothetical protein
MIVDIFVDSVKMLEALLVGALGDSGSFSFESLIPDQLPKPCNYEAYRATTYIL